MEGNETINTEKINRIKEALESKGSLSNTTNALLTMQKIAEIVYSVQQTTECNKPLDRNIKTNGHETHASILQ